MICYPFRPWVRRAGLSIVLTAGGLTLLILALLAAPRLHFDWVRERFVWVYVGTLWLGGLKVWLGTFRPIAETGEAQLILRPLHQFRERSISWEAISGTEQMLGGDRLIVFYETARGLRFVALNLNLVKGRRDFLLGLEGRLRALGFEEKVVERSRYLSRR
jgi:hypothetical protein